MSSFTCLEHWCLKLSDETVRYEETDTPIRSVRQTYSPMTFKEAMLFSIISAVSIQKTIIISIWSILPNPLDIPTFLQHGLVSTDSELWLSRAGWGREDGREAGCRARGWFWPLIGQMGPARPLIGWQGPAGGRVCELPSSEQVISEPRVRPGWTSTWHSHGRDSKGISKPAMSGRQVNNLSEMYKHKTKYFRLQLYDEVS